MTSSSPAKGDIWLAYVAFSDHPERGKVRPVVIVALGEEENRVVAAKITTSAAWPGSTYLEIPNWESCGLRRLSFVQLHPVFKIENAKLLRSAPLGRVPGTFLSSIIEHINASN